MKKHILPVVLLCVLLTGCTYPRKIKVGLDYYAADRAAIEHAAAFLPELESLDAYTDIRYTHQVTSYSTLLQFYSDGLALFVQYDSETYEAQKAQALASYTFLEEPVMYGTEFYTLPLTEFAYRGYLMKVVPDEYYLRSCACKSFMLLGLNDEACSIAYLYYYDFDIDFIAEADDDLTYEMQRFIDDAFYWIDFRLR